MSQLDRATPTDEIDGTYPFCGAHEPDWSLEEAEGLALAKRSGDEEETKPRVTGAAKPIEAD